MKLAAMTLALFCFSIASAGVPTPRWTMLSSPLDFKKVYQVYADRTTGAQALVFGENYQANLPADMRLSAYCKNLLLDAKEVSRDIAKRSCTVSGRSNTGLALMEGAYLSPNDQLFHLIAKSDQKKVSPSPKDYAELLKGLEKGRTP